MLKIILERLKQKYRTSPYPKEDVKMPQLFRGLPKISQPKCNKCEECIQLCPTNAITISDKEVKIDLGSCIFCATCSKTCKKNAITFTDDYKLSTTTRQDLITNGIDYKLAYNLNHEIKKLFGRSLKLRQVSAGGCNACELDTNVLNTPFFDLQRFGISFVASPRHADGMLITGPISKNMELAVMKTYDAIPSPKIVIAVGSCAISGGLFKSSDQTLHGIESIIPVDLYIPGCPPHPMTILDGLLRYLKK